MNERVSGVIQARLAALGRSRRTAAAAAGVNHSFIDDLASGRKKSVRSNNQRALAKALSWSVEELDAALCGDLDPSLPTVTADEAPHAFVVDRRRFQKVLETALRVSGARTPELAEPLAEIIVAVLSREPDQRLGVDPDTYAQIETTVLVEQLLRSSRQERI